MEKEKVVTNKHEYEFEIMTARQGVGLFHEYATLLADHADDLTAVVLSLLKADFGEDEDSEIELEELISTFLSSDSAFVRAAQLVGKTVGVTELFKLAALLLNGCTVDGVECDKDGMCPLFGRNPIELYKALIHAVLVNYRDMLPFSGDDTTDPPAQDEKTTEKS